MSNAKKWGEAYLRARKNFYVALAISICFVPTFYLLFNFYSYTAFLILFIIGIIVLFFKGLFLIIINDKGSQGYLKGDVVLRLFLSAFIIIAIFLIVGFSVCSGSSFDVK